MMWPSPKYIPRHFDDRMLLALLEEHEQLSSKQILEKFRLNESQLCKFRKHWYLPVKDLKTSNRQKGKTVFIRTDHTKKTGATYVQKNGMTLIKLESGKWISKGRYIWEEKHGPIPRGHHVRFKDGDYSNFKLSNLYLAKAGGFIKKNA